jgi:hypothetical protein
MMYRFVTDIWRGAPVYKEHPEYIAHGKDGNDIKGIFSAETVAGNWSPAYTDWLLKSLLDEVDYFGLDVVYLDFPGVAWLPDWGRRIMVKPLIHAAFFKRLHQEMRKRNGMLWINGYTGGYYADIMYYEGMPCGPRYPWRRGASAAITRKLYTRPDTVCIPILWFAGDKSKAEGKYNEGRYRNLIIASGLKNGPCYLDPYDKYFPSPKGGPDQVAILQYQYAVNATTFELIPSEFAEIGLAPAWWKDPKTEYETYTLKQGGAHLLNVISHYPQTQDGEFSLATKEVGLDPAKPVYLWQFFPREDSDFVKTAPQPPGWERMFKEYRFVALQSNENTLKVVLPQLKPEIARLTCLSQTPAFIYSGYGEKCQLLLPDNIGCHVTGKVDVAGKRVALKVEADKSAQILVLWEKDWGGPKVKAEDGRELSCRMESLGGRDWALVDVEKGSTEMTVSQ